MVVNMKKSHNNPVAEFTADTSESVKKLHK